MFKLNCYVHWSPPTSTLGPRRFSFSALNTRYFVLFCIQCIALLQAHASICDYGANSQTFVCLLQSSPEMSDGEDMGDEDIDDQMHREIEEHNDDDRKKVQNWTPLIKGGSAKTSHLHLYQTWLQSIMMKSKTETEDQPEKFSGVYFKMLFLVERKEVQCSFKDEFRSVISSSSFCVTIPTSINVMEILQ